MTDADVRFGPGFYGEEWDGIDRYRWMAPSAELDVAAAVPGSFLELRVFSNFHDLRQTLTVDLGTETAAFRLVHGWNPGRSSHPPTASDGNRLALPGSTNHTTESLVGYHPCGDHRRGQMSDPHACEAHRPSVPASALGGGHRYL